MGGTSSSAVFPMDCKTYIGTTSTASTCPCVPGRVRRTHSPTYRATTNCGNDSFLKAASVLVISRARTASREVCPSQRPILNRKRRQVRVIAPERRAFVHDGPAGLLREACDGARQCLAGLCRIRIGGEQIGVDDRPRRDSRGQSRNGRHELPPESTKRRCRSALYRVNCDETLRADRVRHWILPHARYAPPQALRAHAVKYGNLLPARRDGYVACYQTPDAGLC